jgi:rod shape-determining protein MreC
MEPIKTVASDAVTPMQKGINSVGTWIWDKAEMITTMRALKSENDELKEKLDSVTYDNKVLQQEKYELDNLRKLYDLDQAYPSYPKVAAHVISKDANNWYNVFTIDKGSEDGLKVNMNVIADGGLVGIIIEVGRNCAKVRSIIDDKSEVTGMFLKTSDTCNVKGNLELIDKGIIEVEMIDKDDEVEDGYEVVTAHISDKFLQGILIGYVKDIKVDSSNMTKSGNLTPAVDFESLDMVLVITELKEQYDDLE